MPNPCFPERRPPRLRCINPVAFTLFALTVLSPNLLPAQVQDTNFHGWLMYFGDHPVSDHWGVHLEAQVRRTDGGLAPQQLLLRPALNYMINSHVMLTGGYAFVRTSRYGEFPAAAAFPENRFFEQGLIKHKFGKVAIQHRLRLEQRLVGSVPLPDADVGELGNTAPLSLYAARRHPTSHRKPQQSTLGHWSLR